MPMRQAPRMAAFIPGASPPLVKIAIFLVTMLCARRIAWRAMAEQPAKRAPPPNYITPAGFKRLADELTFLRFKKRPEVVSALADAAAEGDRSENAEYIYRKKQLREIDRRVRFLGKRLDNIAIVDPRDQRRRDHVFFGAEVTVADDQGEEHTYRIVGVDEVEGSQGVISWKSPVGRALLGKA